MNKSERLTNRHLHPISILYFVIIAIKETVSFIWVFPLLVLFVHQLIDKQISPLTINIISGVFLIMLYFILAVLKWYTFTYRIHESAIYVESGLFVTKKRWVTPDHIQSINFTVRVFDHLFSTRTLTMEIAGGDESSITLSCISREEEERIRRVLRMYDKDNQIDILEESVLQLSNRDLILHSILSPKFAIILSLIIAGLLKYWDMTNETERDTLFTYLSNWFGSNWMMITVLIIVLLSFALSLLGTFIGDYHFTLSKNSKGDLQIGQGLFEKKNRTIAQNRIQAILITERPLQRLLGYASIEAVVIRSSQDEQNEKTITILPFVKKEIAHSLLEPFIEYQMSNSLNMLTTKAKFHYTGLPFILGCLIAIPIWLFVPNNFNYLATIIPFAFLFLGWMEYRMIGWNQSEYFLTLQYGNLTRKTVIIKRGRIQWSSVTQTYMQEKKDLASMKVAVASGKEKIKFSLPYIPLKEAIKIYQYTSK